VSPLLAFLPVEQARELEIVIWHDALPYWLTADGQLVRCNNRSSEEFERFYFMSRREAIAMIVKRLGKKIARKIENVSNYY
jgi:hypothetical protein